MRRVVAFSPLPVPGSHYTVGRMGFRAGPDAPKKRKYLAHSANPTTTPWIPRP